MSKKLFAALFIGFFMCATIGSAFAMEAGNARKGKYAYRNLYKACHERGAVESDKPVLNPDAKTQAQWTRMFDKKDFEDFKCEEEWSKVDENTLKDIYSYLFEHAADSPTPAKCK